MRQFSYYYTNQWFAHANSVWCPYKMGDIKEIENVQKEQPKLIISLKNVFHKQASTSEASYVKTQKTVGR